MEKYYTLAVNYRGYGNNRLEVREHVQIDKDIIKKECPVLSDYKVRTLSGSCPIPKNSNAKTDNKNPNIQVIKDIYTPRMNYWPVFFVSKKEINDFLNSGYFGNGYYQHNHYALDESFLILEDDVQINCGEFIHDVYQVDYRPTKYMPQSWIEFYDKMERDYNGLYGYYITKEYDENIPIVTYDVFLRAVKIKDSDIECNDVETVDKYIDMIRSNDIATKNVGIKALLQVDMIKCFPYVAYANYITGCISSSQSNEAKVLKKRYPNIVNAVKDKVSYYDEGNHNKLYPMTLMLQCFEDYGWDKIPEDIIKRVDEEFDECFTNIIKGLGSRCANYTKRYLLNHKFGKQ